MIDLVRDLAPLLGSAKDEATFRRVAEVVGGPGKTSRYGPITYWNYREAGISLHFSGSRLDTVFLGPVASEAPPFQGTLGRGLTFQARRREVHAALGPPAQSTPGGPNYCDECEAKTHLISVDPFRDRYEYPTYGLLFEFGGEGKRKSKDPLEVVLPPECPPDELPIRLVMISEKGHDPAIKDPPPARLSADDKEISAEFFCAKCRKPAGTLTLALNDTRLRLSQGESLGVGPERLQDLKQALERGDAAALHKLGQYWAPMYCPACRACYCKAHWFLDDGPPPWGDSYSMDWVEFGTCPEGHRRILREL